MIFQHQASYIHMNVTFAFLFCFFSPFSHNSSKCEYSGSDSDSSRDAKTEKSSPRMMSLWKSALDSGKALLLDKTDLDPEQLLEKVEEFGNISQVVEHSYPALLMSSEDSLQLKQQNSNTTANSDFNEQETYTEEFDDESHISYSFKEADLTLPPGSLPVDSIVRQLSDDFED